MLDNLDGSYSIGVAGSNRERKTTLKVRIQGATLSIPLADRTIQDPGKEPKAEQMKGER